MDALRHPALHFVVLGGLLYLASRLLFPEPVPERTRHERLLEAAYARGYAQTDPIVRARLLRNLRFVNPDDPRSDDELIAEAYELGMERGDPVVERRLVQKMLLLAWSRADAQPPSDAEVRAAFEADPERYAEPARVSFRHVFLSNDRGPDAEADARALAPRLAGLDAAAGPALGDPFLLGPRFQGMTAEQLTDALGPGLAEASGSAAIGVWSGPVPSSYGWHWIHVEERQPGRPASLDAARPAVLHELRERRREAAVADLLRGLD